jgi:hypothetical protein
MLGCHKAPIGSQTKQKIVLKTKCTEFAKVVNCTALTRTDSLIFYRHINVPSVSYPLSSTYFKASELDEIQSKSNRAITRCCGYWKGTAWDIIYGPTDYGGADFLNFVDSQGLQQIQMVVKHWRTPGVPCDLTKVSLAWWQFVAGTSIPIMEDHRFLPQIWKESKLIESIRQYLLSIDATIEFNNTYIPPLQREGDAYFMDIVLESGLFTTTEVTYINWCRLFLQVVTVSDMATASGDKLDKAMYHGEISIKSSSTRWYKCHQARPEKQYVWDLWHRACMLVARRNLELFTPLGKWLMPASQLRREWPAYYNPTADSMYRPIPLGGYSIHRKDHNGYSYASQRNTLILPPDTIPVELEDSEHTLVKCTTYKKILPLEPEPAPPTNYKQYFNTLEPWERQLFIGLNVSIPDDEMAQLLQSGEFLIGSDGSAPDRASFGWMMSKLDGTRVANCSGPVCGRKPISFRAESYGILSALRFVVRFLQYTNTPMQGSYSHLTDAKSVLDRLDTVSTHTQCFANSTLEPEWDVINEITVTLQSMEHPPTITYEAGHQDDHKPYHQLSLRAQLNCDADKLAERYLRMTDPHGTPDLDETRVTLLPNAGAQVHLKSGTVTGKLKRPLTNASRGPPLLEHIRIKNNWDPTTIDLVDWDSHGIAVRNAPHPVTVVKTLHGLLPVGARTSKYDPKYSSICPSCHTAKETTDQFYRCSCPSRKQWRSGFLKTILDTAVKIDRRPKLMEIMYEGALGYLQGKEYLDPLRFEDCYRELIRQQNRIGWLNFLKGRWSLLWNKQQRHYMLEPKPNYTSKSKQKSKRKSGNSNWSVTMMRQIWDSLYSLWEQRNKDLHGHDPKTQQEARKRLYLREIQMYYDNQLEYPQDMQHVFKTPLEQFYDKTNYQLYSWLEIWKPVLATEDDSEPENNTA